MTFAAKTLEQTNRSKLAKTIDLRMVFLFPGLKPYD
jgi:hypothetical protein